MFYKKKAISAELYTWLLKNRYADALLIAKWKKQGYENLCCLRCIQAKQNVNGGTCICRVPRAHFGKDPSGANNSEEEEEEEPNKKKKAKIKHVHCVTCGCRGCASTD